MNFRLLFNGLKLATIAAFLTPALLSGCGKETVPPKIDVRFNPRGFFRTITITSKDDRRLSVSKVIINRKVDNNECVLTKTALEHVEIKTIELDIGDYFNVFADSSCNNPMVVGLITSLGDYEVEMFYKD